jgi:cyclase
VKDGKVVKGIKFKNLKWVGDPPERATEYEKQGADEIVFLDISASLEDRGTMLRVVERTAERLFVPLAVGGGIRSKEDMRDALNAGADKVSINSFAVAQPDVIPICAEDFGSQCVVVAIDGKREGDSWKVWTHGGTRRTELDAIEWAVRVEDLGAGEILLTSMDADGTQDGYDIELTAAIADEVNIPVIASGGCGSIEHIYEVFTQTKADAALAASIFHYDTHTVGEVKEYLKDRGVRVRL